MNENEEQHPNPDGVYAVIVGAIMFVCAISVILLT